MLQLICSQMQKKHPFHETGNLLSSLSFGPLCCYRNRSMRPTVSTCCSHLSGSLATHSISSAHRPSTGRMRWVCPQESMPLFSPSTPPSPSTLPLPTPCLFFPPSFSLFPPSLPLPLTSLAPSPSLLPPSPPSPLSFFPASNLPI